MAAAVISGVLGFYWSSARASRRKLAANQNQEFWRLTAKGGVVWAITCLPAYVLDFWNFGRLNPWLAIWWTAGFASGAIFGWHLTVSRSAAIADGLPKPERKTARRIAARHLASEGAERAEKEVKNFCDGYRRKCKKTDTAHAKRLAAAVDALHDFVHSARDEAQSFASRLDDSKPLLVVSRDSGAYRQAVATNFKGYYQVVLSDLIRVFEPLAVEGADLWAAVRQISRDEGGGGNVYRTLTRQPGRYSSREEGTLAIPELGGIAQYLRTELASGPRRGVVLLPDAKAKARAGWIQTKQDDSKDDLTVLAAPVCRRNPKTGEREVVFILYVNSTVADALHPDARRFMRCCSDVLSTTFFTRLPDLPSAQREVHLRL